MGKTFKESYTDSKQETTARKYFAKKKIKHRKMEAYKRTRVVA